MTDQAQKMMQDSVKDLMETLDRDHLRKIQVGLIRILII